MRESAAQYLSLALVLIVAFLAGAVLVAGPSSGAPVGVSVGQGASMGNDVPHLNFYVDKPAEVGDMIIFDAGDHYIGHEAIKRTDDGFLTSASIGRTADQHFLGADAPKATESNTVGVVVASVSTLHLAIALLVGLVLIFGSVPDLNRGSPKGRIAGVLVLVLLVSTAPVTGAVSLENGPNRADVSGPDSELELKTLGDTGTVYVGSDDNDVYALDSETGAVEWSYTAGGSIRSGPTVVNGTVYVGTDGNNILALNASDGTQEWSYAAAGPVSSPTIVGGTVYVGTGSTTASVAAVNASDGTEEWTFDAGSTVDGAPAVVNGSVYAGANDGELYSLDASTGSKNWNFTASNSLNPSPNVVNGTVFIGSDDYNMYAVNASDGAEEWRFSTGGRIEGSATVVNGTVFFGSVGGSVYAVDSSDGSEDWSFATTSNVVDGVTVSNGLVYVGTYQPRVHALDQATGSEEWSYTPGGNALSTPTVADGTVYFGSDDFNVYGLDASTGTEEWSYSTGDRVRSSPTFVASGGNKSTGSRVSQNTLGYHDQGTVAVDSSVSVSGVVRDQNGNPVENATVKVTGVDHSQISLNNADSLEERADDLLDQARNAKPPGWDQDLELTGGNGLFGEVSSEYPAVHTKPEWGLAGYSDGNDLSEPNVQVPANEPVILSAWDPTNGNVIQDGVDDELPGATVEREITLTHLDSTGDGVKTETITATHYYDAFGSTKDHAYAEIELSPGFYRVSVKGSDDSYVITAGKPDEIAAAIEQALKDEADQLTDRAKDLRQKFQDGKFVSTTVTTDENGRFSAQVGSEVKTVSISAYRVPRGMDPQNATRADISEWYNAQTFDVNTQETGGFDVAVEENFDRSNANLTSEADLESAVPAFYLPERPVRQDVPGENVTINVYKTSVPDWANTSVTANRSKWKENFLANLSYSDLPAALQQRLDQLNDTQATLEEVRNELHNVSKENDQLTKRVEELLAEQRNSTVEEVREQLAEQDKTNEELRQEIRALRQAMTELDTTVTIEDPEVDKTADTVSLAWTIPSRMNIEEGNVSVLAHYANGTSQTVAEQYVTVDTGVGNDVVRVSEYPLGDADPASVEFELQAATSEDFGARSDVVKNPTFDGALPSLDSVSVSTINPGPSENVTVEVNPSESGSWKKITGVTVYGPDGNEINTSGVQDGTTFRFTTNGAGVHHAAISAETTGGETVEIPVRIKAVGTELDAPPTISAKSSPVGEYLLTSGEFAGAEIEKENAGELTSITAQLPADADVPTEIDVHLEEVAIPSSSKTTVTLVRGDEEQALDKHVPVTLHFSAPDDTVLVWRNGEPVTQSGNRYGKVNAKSNALVVDTYTAADGTVTVRRANNPTWGTRISYELDRFFQTLPVVIQLPALPLPPVDAVGLEAPPMQAATPDAPELSPDAATLSEVVAV